jgi:hypothetical protein
MIIYYIHVDVVSDKNRKAYDREGQKIPATFPQFLSFSGFPKGFLIIRKKMLRCFLEKVKRVCENLKKSKVAGKLREFCGNFCPLSNITYTKII